MKCVLTITVTPCSPIALTPRAWRSLGVSTADKHGEARLFRPRVRPEHHKHPAAPTGEATWATGGDAPNPPHQIVDRDNPLVAIDRRRMLERHSDARPI